MSLAERSTSGIFQSEPNSLFFTLPQNETSSQIFEFELSGALPTKAKQIDTELFKRFLKNNSQVRSEDLADNQQVEVTDFIPYEGIVNERGIKKKVKGNLLQTAEHGGLLIIPPTTKLRLREKSFLIDDAQNALALRQDRKEIAEYTPLSQNSEINISNTRADHQHVEALLFAGWNHLLPTLYGDRIPNDQLTSFREIFLKDYKLLFDQNNPSLHEQAARSWLEHQNRPRTITLQAGIESPISQLFPSCGTADLVGEGPDRLFAVDIGAVKKNKVKQTIKQQLGLAQLLNDNNVSAQPSDITTYIAPYFRDLDSHQDPLYIVNLIPISETLSQNI